MVQILHGREHSSKNEKPFKETSVLNKAPLDAPHCPECGENIRQRGDDDVASCPYCGYKENKHVNYNAYKYEREIISQGLYFSVYRVKGKRRRKADSRDIELEAERLVEEWGDDLLVKKKED